MKQTYPEFLEDTENFIFVESKPEQADIILFRETVIRRWQNRQPGCIKKEWQPGCLPSGRYSVINQKFSGVLSKGDIYNGTYETEWEFLRDVLIKNGVPKERILREDMATFTYENAIYSRQVTDQAGLNIKKAILVL